MSLGGDAARWDRVALAWTSLLGDIVEEEVATLPDFASQAEVDQYIAKIEAEMREAAKRFEFEKAARLRDSIKELRDKEFLFG